MPKNLAASPEVIEISKINFSGNVLPESWFHELKHNGKTYINAVVILSEIVWWYRPIEIRDEETGRVTQMARKFKGEILQRSYQSLAHKFGMSKKQVADACKFLQSLGLIYLHVEKSMVLPSGDRLGNVLFIKIYPQRINEITHPLLPESNRVVPESNRVVPESNRVVPESNSYIPGSNTNTESKEITTKTSKRSKDPPLTPPQGGGGVKKSFQEEQPNSQTADRTTATIAPTQSQSPDQPRTSNGQGQYSAARREPKSIRNVRRHYGECLPPWRVGWGVGKYTPEILEYTERYLAKLPANSAIAQYTPIQLLEEYEEKERWANLESRATNLANGHDNNGSICARYLAEIPCPSNSEWYMENQKLDLADDLTLMRIHWERLGLEPEDSRWANWLSRAAPELDPSSGINDLPTWIIPKLATDLQNTYQPC
jgi:hypothetical protein